MSEHGWIHWSKQAGHPLSILLSYRIKPLIYSKKDMEITWIITAKDPVQHMHTVKKKADFRDY